MTIISATAGDSPHECRIPVGSASTSASDRLILVIDHSSDRSRNLKELIEFMDAPCVCTATPRDWESCVAGRRLAAVFVQSDLTDDETTDLLEGIGKLDPNVPIVMVNGEPHA